jgi:5-methylcytosine-specific restriction endonuclease McrA
VNKVCTKCKVEKVLEEFYAHKRGKHGRLAECKVCNKIYRAENKEKIAAYSKIYGAENKEKIAARGKLYRKENKEKVRIRRKKYKIENKEKIAAQRKIYNAKNAKQIAAQRKEWWSENKEKMSAYYKKHSARYAARNARRHAMKLNATPPDADLKVIQEFYKSAHRVSKCLGIPMHVDHVQPLSKGGLHIESNLRVISATENLRKNNKMPNEFYNI